MCVGRYHDGPATGNANLRLPDQKLNFKGGESPETLLVLEQTPESWQNFHPDCRYLNRCLNGPHLLNERAPE